MEMKPDGRRTLCDMALLDKEGDHASDDQTIIGSPT